MISKLISWHAVNASKNDSYRLWHEFMRVKERANEKKREKKTNSNVKTLFNDHTFNYNFCCNSFFVYLLYIYIRAHTSLFNFRKMLCLRNAKVVLFCGRELSFVNGFHPNDFLPSFHKFQFDMQIFELFFCFCVCHMCV